jgi:hypothetical protein
MKSQNNIARREFMGAALIGALTAGGLLSAVKADETAASVYREELQTPIVSRYQVIIAGGGPAGFIAALATKTNTPPRKLDVKTLQKLLLSQNAELRM